MAKVMIVDDAAFMRANLKNILEDSGHKIIEEAENGKDAIEKFKEVKPELVTMDITMPEMDGLEALKNILKIDPEARVVMCSAMGQQAMVIEAIQAGAKDFIVKPFKKDRIQKALDKAIG